VGTIDSGTNPSEPTSECGLGNGRIPLNPQRPSRARSTEHHSRVKYVVPAIDINNVNIKMLVNPTVKISLFIFECMSGGNVGLSDNARTNESWYHDSNVIKSGHTFVRLVAMLNHVMTHVQVSHVIDMFEWVHTRCHTSIRDWMRMCCSALQHTATHCNTLHYNARKKESWHRNDWVNSHVWISHTCEFDMSQVWMSRVTRMYESYYRNDWVKSNIWQWLILTCVIVFSCNIITKKEKTYERC